MDESRKQFAEAFEELTGWNLEEYLEEHPNQTYADTCWQFWKMSREAIEIELPEADLVYSSATDSYGIEGCMMLPESLVERVLQDAGIKVKE